MTRWRIAVGLVLFVFLGIPLVFPLLRLLADPDAWRSLGRGRPIVVAGAEQRRSHGRRRGGDSPARHVGGRPPLPNQSSLPPNLPLPHRSWPYSYRCRCLRPVGKPYSVQPAGCRWAGGTRPVRAPPAPPRPAASGRRGARASAPPSGYTPRPVYPGSSSWSGKACAGWSAIWKRTL